MFVGSWLASATVLFLGTWILNPIDPTLYFPTSMAAQVAPLLAIAGAMSLVGVWSRDGKVLLALSLSAAFAPLTIPFVLVATCVVQSNCL